MPVMVMDTLLANQLQLHSENLDCTARVKADAAIKDLVTKFVSRLKNPDNYTGQAGRNLYEDIIDAHIDCFKVGLGLVKSFELTIARQAIFNEMRSEGGSQNASQEPILSRLIKERYSKDQATIYKAAFTQQKAEREEKRQTAKDSTKRSLDEFLRQQQGPPQQQGRPQPKGGNFRDTSHIPCRSWRRGHCPYGDACKFGHFPPEGPLPPVRRECTAIAFPGSKLYQREHGVPVRSPALGRLNQYSRMSRAPWPAVRGSSILD